MPDQLSIWMGSTPFGPPRSPTGLLHIGCRPRVVESLPCSLKNWYEDCLTISVHVHMLTVITTKLTNSSTFSKVCSVLWLSSSLYILQVFVTLPVAMARLQSTAILPTPRPGACNGVIALKLHYIHDLKHPRPVSQNLRNLLPVWLEA